MARPCTICCCAEMARITEELVAAGASDQTIASRLGGMSRMAVSRHRANHILKPAQDRLTILRKGGALREEREQLAHAAAADAPTPQAFVDAVLGMKAQTEKLAAVEARLERMAALAEAGKSPGGVAQLSAQQLRSVEVGSKLAGTGGYAPSRAFDGGNGGGAPFAVNIYLSEGRTKSFTVVAPSPTIDADTDETD